MSLIPERILVISVYSHCQKCPFSDLLTCYFLMFHPNQERWESDPVKKNQIKTAAVPQGKQMILLEGGVCPDLPCHLICMITCHDLFTFLFIVFHFQSRVSAMPVYLSHHHAPSQSL